MAKKFNEQFKQREQKKTADVTATAKGMLSNTTTGEHKEGYKDVFIKLRITAEEKELWQAKAKEQYDKPLSAFIRENVNYNIEHGTTAYELLKK